MKDKAVFVIICIVYNSCCVYSFLFRLKACAAACVAAVYAVLDATNGANGQTGT